MGSVVLFITAMQYCSVDETPKGAQKQVAAEAEAEDLTFVGDIPEFAPEQHPMRGIVVGVSKVLIIY